MKIAVTYENGQVFQHFGHTEAFKVYETENNEIKSESIIPTLGNGHGALAGFLKLNNVDTLICGGIGEGAKNALASAGIKLYGGVTGSADEAVKALLCGTLDFTVRRIPAASMVVGIWMSSNYIIVVHLNGQTETDVKNHARFLICVWFRRNLIRPRLPLRFRLQV